MRGSTIETIRGMVKTELGESDKANTALDSWIDRLIVNEAKYLSSEYDWPFLGQRWDLQVPPNTRYLPIPQTTVAIGNYSSIVTAINFERPVQLYSKYDAFWLPMEYGITPMHFNDTDSDEGEVDLDVSRWRFATNIGDIPDGYIELWPIPSAQTIVRFTGQRSLRSMTTSSARVDIDDVLIAFLVAAKILQQRKQANAGIKGQLASQRLLRLRASYPAMDEAFVIGGCPAPKRSEKFYVTGIAGGGTGGGGGGDTSMQISGVTPIPENATELTVTIAPNFTPVAVSAIVSAPEGGDNILATLKELPSNTAFTVTFTGLPGVGYNLVWSVFA